MITKAYLDGKLGQLEESLKRKIEMKDNIHLEEIDKKFLDLREIVDSINEKVIENKDILDNYLVQHNGLKQRLEELEAKIEKPVDNENDESGQITDDLQ